MQAVRRSFKWGDVNGSGSADAGDAADILAIKTGTVNEGPYVIGTDIVLKAGGSFKWGDVNGSGSADAGDAADILAIKTGTVNEGPYVIGTDLELEIVEK